MTETPPDPLQAALDQIEALGRVASQAAGATATVEHDLVTLTLSAAPSVDAIDFTWSAMRDVSSEALADAVLAAIADATSQVQAAQVEQLRDSPLAGLLSLGDPAGLGMPADDVERARTAAAGLVERDFEARDADGRVEVTVDGSLAVTRLWLSATATRESAAEWLPQAVRSTLNDAWSRAGKAQQAAVGVDTSEIEARLDEVVGAAEARMQALNSRLDDVARRLDGLG